MFDSFISFPVPLSDDNENNEQNLHPLNPPVAQQQKQHSNTSHKTSKGLLDLIDTSQDEPSIVSSTPISPFIIKHKEQANEIGLDTQNETIKTTSENTTNIAKDNLPPIPTNHSNLFHENTTTTTTTNNNNNNSIRTSGNKILKSSGGSSIVQKNLISLEKQLNDWQTDFYPSLAYKQKNKHKKHKQRKQLPVDNNSQLFDESYNKAANNNISLCEEESDLLSKRVAQWQHDINSEIEGFSQSFISSLPERLKDFHKSSKDKQPLFLTPISSITPLSGSPASTSPTLSSNSNSSSSSSRSNSCSTASSNLLSPLPPHSMNKLILDEEGDTLQKEKEREYKDRSEEIDEDEDEENKEVLEEIVNIESNNNNNKEQIIPEIKVQTTSPKLHVSSRFSSPTELKMSTDDLETNFQTWRRIFNEKMDQRMKINDIKTHGKIQIS